VASRFELTANFCLAAELNGKGCRRFRIPLVADELRESGLI
jgi:hypothetical protein